MCQDTCGIACLQRRNRIKRSCKTNNEGWGKTESTTAIWESRMASQLKTNREITCQVSLFINLSTYTYLPLSIYIYIHTYLSASCTCNCKVSSNKKIKESCQLQQYISVKVIETCNFKLQWLTYIVFIFQPLAFSGASCLLVSGQGLFHWHRFHPRVSNWSPANKKLVSFLRAGFWIPFFQERFGGQTFKRMVQSVGWSFPGE